MSSFDHEQLARALLPAVLEAGAIEMRHYREGVAVETKADASPVTAADREAEAVLLAALARVAPGIPVIAEEAVSQGTIPAVAASFFLVDPLDGTREFINRRGEFTVNVALIEQGQPVFGIVYAPALSEFYATLGAARAVFARMAPHDAGKNLATYGGADIRTRSPDPRRTHGHRQPLASDAGDGPVSGATFASPIAATPGRPSSSACWREVRPTSTRASGRPWSGIRRPVMPFWWRPADA